MNPRDVKYFTVTGYGVQDIEECEYEYAKFIEVEDFDALTLDLAYSENALYDAEKLWQTAFHLLDESLILCGSDAFKTFGLDVRIKRFLDANSKDSPHA